MVRRSVSFNTKTLGSLQLQVKNMNRRPSNTYKKNLNIKRRKQRKLNKAGIMITLTGVLVVVTGLLFLGNHFDLFDFSSSASVESTDLPTKPSESTAKSDASTTTTEPAVTSEAATGGTEASASPTLTPIPDAVPPIISGTSDISVYVGDTVSYRKNVLVEDDTDNQPVLEIDSSQVNLNAPGTYPVYYIATDSAGNKSEKEIKITVKERTVPSYGMDEMLAQAGMILDEILEPGMSQLQQAEAIYWWTKQHIVYVNHSDKSDWLQGAWQGINKGSGDCFNYFATAKLLLTKAGIENVDVIKSTGSHYWSLVNVGEGYYHFDTTPRKAGGEFFMLTDQEITAYSDQHGYSHVWDRDKYPTTPQE